MNRTPQPGNRLIPKPPYDNIHAVTDSGLVYAYAPEVRITTSASYPGGVAVAMWEGAGSHVCYIPVSDLDPDTYVFSDYTSDSRPASTVLDTVTPDDIGKLVRVSGEEKSITGYIVGIHVSMNPINAGASHPVLLDPVTELCLRSASHYKDTTTVRIYSDDQIEFLDEDNK